MQTHKNKKIIRSIGKYLIIVALVLVFLFPIYWMVISSLTPSNFLMSLPPHLIPVKTTFHNYTKIFARPQYVRYFINSFIVSGGTVLLVLIISIPASFAFSRYKFAFKNAILTSIMSVQMFPIVVILISLYTFYLQWGLIDTYRGLILADAVFALPLAIMLMKSFFDTLPKSLDESAKIDGAGRFQTLFKVLLPLTLPGIIAVGIYTFLTAWDDFLMALTVMTSDSMKTLPVGLAQSFLGEYAHDYGGLMAFSVAGSLPIVILFIFFQRYMIEGLTAGAVKG